ncbi:LacI family DNA-binding transcriptional regulator [Alkalibacter mobilis]|uniref:LacI family DNA-binding transcriptional regulator n=1 Tax=Alkalibacter mobilis TaxID=2787712 RepID=UPI0018A0571F|nr:LacI family DNA-binding transcriptional regulator [Alkalibacter mobilis]MBF7097308.1 LacI family DNA-binding transcriptional regulator [Alkalibacter mobilis]
MKSRINITQIAKMAGVSKTTVSRVLNNKPDVKAESREKIERIIKKYNYYPNAYAKAVSNKKSNTICAVIPHDASYVFSNPYYSEILRGVSQMTNANNYQLLLSFSDDGKYVDIAKEQRADGIILISPSCEDYDQIDELVDMAMPLVSASKVLNSQFVCHICVNDSKGAYLATEHLLNLGHKKIGFINGPYNLASSRDRYEGYASALKQKGISVDETFTQEGRNSLESGYESMQKLLKNVNLTAVVVSSDLMAIGAIKAVNEAGKKVPDDISIVGFDDIPFAPYVNPPLTTINQDAYFKGMAVAEKLIQIINNENVEYRTTMDVELKIRESTTRCKA